MINPPNINYETFVVLWSAKQELFHVETISDMLESGKNSYAYETAPSYIPIAFADSREQCHILIKKLKDFKGAEIIQFDSIIPKDE